MNIPRATGSISWKASALIATMILVLGLGTALAVNNPPVILDSPEFPPESNPEDCNDLLSVYASQSGTTYFVDQDVMLMLIDPVIKCFQNVQRVPIDPFTERQEFMATMDATLVLVGLGEEIPLHFEGWIVTETMNVPTDKSDQQLVFLEMLFIAGPEEPPIGIALIPESPSFGEFHTTDLGNGQFLVESFFDVWTMISGDGEEWIPATGPLHMDLLSVNDPLPLDRSTTWGQLKGMYR